MNKRTIIVSSDLDGIEELPGSTKIYRISSGIDVLVWASQFGELMDDETLDGYRRLWYKTANGGTTVVEYLIKE